MPVQKKLLLRLLPVLLALCMFVISDSALAQYGSYPACTDGDFPGQACDGECISERDLCILEPLPGQPNNIPASATSGMGAFFYYVNSGVWQWAFRSGIAIAILNGTFGGLEIVLSNGDSGKIEAGKSRFLWSTGGLIILLLAGVILEFINPAGFVNI